MSKNIIEKLQQFQVTNIIAEVKDYVFINNHDPRLFEGSLWGILESKLVTYLNNLMKHLHHC